MQSAHSLRELRIYSMVLTQEFTAKDTVLMIHIHTFMKKITIRQQQSSVVRMSLNRTPTKGPRR
jgi:hypothetical protein